VIRNTVTKTFMFSLLFFFSHSYAADDISLYGFSVNGKQHAAIVLRQGLERGHMEDLASFDAV